MAVLDKVVQCNYHQTQDVVVTFEHEKGCPTLQGLII